jgi:hypothetical protein
MFFANILNLRPRLRPLKTKRVRNYRADERLQQLWLKLSAEYFPQQEHLSLYIVRWSSRRQKRVLGSCHLKRRHVVMAKELDRPEHWEWVEAVLYHEMCHAVLEDSVQRRRGKRQWHGEDFKLLEVRHPLTAALKDWINAGGWHRAVRSDRSRRAAASRCSGKEPE